MSKIADFKKKLARVFDNNLKTEQWSNILDYVIIGLIILVVAILVLLLVLLVKIIKKVGLL